MKKLLSVFMMGLIGSVTLAGGIVTNSNQSAQYIRMLARDVSTSIDAIYYNPAGLTQLADGFYVSLSNQSIFQKKTIENTYPYLNEKKYVGDIAVPAYPDVYFAYKKDKFAIGFGFQPNAGGGSAKYDTGLPSFEIPYASLPATLSDMYGAGFCSEYSADIQFNGSSIFWGAQLNASYKLSDIISASLGGRLVFAKNTYEGHIRNVMIDPKHPVINPSGGLMLASDFFTAAGNAAYAAMTSDQEVDAEQTGVGYTPIIGVNLNLGEKLNVGLKYEFRTKLELENETRKDMVVPQFIDGAKIRNDIPALLSVGATFKVLPVLRVSGGLHYFFDKDATIEKAPGVAKDIDGNMYEFSLGGEYDITEKILVSVGYLYARTGVGQGYQTDLSHSLTSSSVGFGGEFKVTEKLSLDLGMLYTMYTSDAKNSSYTLATARVVPYKETYNRTNINFSFGVTYHF
ncbi:MAG: outer membrane protein transport protein [Bacteroidales bacterium]|nr:outer membrane protein transport protein [Bacteroidales bacterium]